jgi:hypothetical protein
MMLNIRDLLFNPTKYVRDFAMGLEESHTVGGDLHNAYELANASRPKRPNQRSRIAFAHSEPGPEDEWTFSFNSNAAPGPTSDVKQGRIGSPTSKDFPRPVSMASMENQGQIADDADSGDVVFANSPTPSTTGPTLPPLKTIYEGGSVQPSPV